MKKAKTEKAVIQRDKNDTPALAKQEDDLPEDFYEGITRDELMKGIEQDLRDMFKQKEAQKNNKDCRE